MPVHAFFEGGDFGERGTRNGHEGDVVVREVEVGAVYGIGDEGAGGAALGPARFGAEHEMVDDELAAAVEQIGEGFFLPAGVSKR